MWLLGIGFLQQGTPELVVGGGVKHDELISHRWQPVVHHDVQPFVVLPELRGGNRENFVSVAHYLLSVMYKVCIAPL